MGKTVKTVIITVLCTLGVLFIILMLLPDDEEETADTGTGAVTETAAVQEEPSSGKEESGKLEITGVTSQGGTAPEKPEESEEPGEPEGSGDAEPSDPAEDAGAEPQTGSGKGAEVRIPASELSSKTLKFKTTTLEGDTVTQDIFGDYDITVVHVWGTYCGPCIAEMGEYAKLGRELPGNVNLIGIVCDVYDGIGNNEKEAKKILGDAGAGFRNLRTSDSVYDVIENIQYIPSSFFVDREGHLIGDMLIGAGFEETLSRLNTYLP